MSLRALARGPKASDRSFKPQAWGVQPRRWPRGWREAESHSCVAKNLAGKGLSLIRLAQPPIAVETEVSVEF